MECRDDLVQAAVRKASEVKSNPVFERDTNRKREGRLRFRKRPSYFDGGKPNSVGVFAHADDHLSHPAFAGRPIPQLRDRDATIPEDQRAGCPPSVCLAPHGVFPASRITPRAVSSYLAFSTLPFLCCQRTGGVFSVTLSVTAVFQVRRPRVLRGMLPYGVRTFLQQAKRLTSDHLPSASNLAQDRKAGSHESKRNQDRRKKG